MTAPETNDNTHTVNFDADTLAPRELRVVLVCDVVESVRWMEQDEDYAVTRWQAFAHHVRGTIVPAHGGSVVKSTGDGMMVEFTNARSAVQAANALHAKAAQGNTDPNPQRHLQLRTGIHETHARRDAHDLYGHGVNLAARITTLAGPGEIIVSAPVRDHLTDSLDGDIEDMGECYLKHIAEPQRVYRVGVASAEPILMPTTEYADALQPTMAVIPFESRSHLPEHFAIGELIADGVIAQLGQSKYLQVHSRLSTSALRGRELSGQYIAQLTGADYCVNGSYAVMGRKILVIAAVTKTGSDKVIASERISGDVEDLVADQSEICHRLSVFAHQCINQEVIDTARCKPIPNVQSFGLLLSGINMMNCASLDSFEKSIQVFDHLIERHSRNCTLRAWRAKWRLWRVMNGMSNDPVRESALARADVLSGLDMDDSHPLSLAVYGQVCNQLLDQPDQALGLFERALQRSPSESLAWLFKSVHSSMWGSTEMAQDEANKAYSLSRLDPSKYIYLMAMANAHLSNNQHAAAIENATASLQCNASHAPTLRILFTACVESNLQHQALQTLGKLKMVQPNLSVRNYTALGGTSSRTRQRFISALESMTTT